MMLAALFLSAQAPSGPPTDPLAFDLHCMIATASLRDSPDPTIRANGTAAALFFFGRVDARLSEAELERRIVAETPPVQHEDRVQLMHACGQFMSERGQVLVGIGQRISAREQRTPTQ